MERLPCLFNTILNLKARENENTKREDEMVQKTKRKRRTTKPHKFPDNGPRPISLCRPQNIGIPRPLIASLKEKVQERAERERTEKALALYLARVPLMLRMQVWLLQLRVNVLNTLTLSIL